jgi:hypothetical protein
LVFDNAFYFVNDLHDVDDDGLFDALGGKK